VPVERVVVFGRGHGRAAEVGGRNRRSIRDQRKASAEEFRVVVGDKVVESSVVGEEMSPWGREESAGRGGQSCGRSKGG
jgi:hypothetical protein